MHNYNELIRVIQKLYLIYLSRDKQKKNVGLINHLQKNVNAAHSNPTDDNDGHHTDQNDQQKTANKLVLIPLAIEGALEEYLAKQDSALVDKEQLDKCLDVLCTAVPDIDVHGARSLYYQAAIHALAVLAYTNFDWSREDIVDAGLGYVLSAGGLELILRICLSEHFPDFIRGRAALVLWTFCSDTQRLRICTEQGAWKAALKLAKMNSSEIQEYAAAVLWGFLEFDSVKAMAMEEGLLDVLLPLYKHSRNAPAEVHCIGCIQTCSFSPVCREPMIVKGAMELIIERYRAIEDRYLRYLTCLSLCNLLMHDGTVADQDEALECITDFLEEYEPEEIAKSEQEHNAFWSFLHPFVTLTTSRYAPVQRMGTFACAALAYSPENRRKLESDGFKERLMCLVWAHDEQIRKYAKEIISHFINNTQLKEKKNEDEEEQEEHSHDDTDDTDDDEDEAKEGGQEGAKKKRERRECGSITAPSLLELCLFNLRRQCLADTNRLATLQIDQLPTTLSERLRTGLLSL